MAQHLIEKHDGFHDPYDPGKIWKYKLINHFRKHSRETCSRVGWDKEGRDPRVGQNWEE